MVQLKKRLAFRRRPVYAPPVAVSADMQDPDVYVVTSEAIRIPAHSKILASASPILEEIIERTKKDLGKIPEIPILGVPYGAVCEFLLFLNSSKCSDEQIKMYGVHLLALSHVYSVEQLKMRCARGLAERLTVENVVDMIQLARLCHSPHLYLKCMKIIIKDFKTVEETEGWKFLQEHDPHLELEILQFIDEEEQRKQRAKKERESQKLYMNLSEAMDCLVHICTEGCTSVGPYNMDTNREKGPCSKFSTCHGIQLLLKHFATCEKKVKGGCLRCVRMWQLFRLHSSICEQGDECKVPLCRKFKVTEEYRRKRNDSRWRLLARKVVSAKAISSLSSFKRTRVEEEAKRLRTSMGTC